MDTPAPVGRKLGRHNGRTPPRAANSTTPPLIFESYWFKTSNFLEKQLDDSLVPHLCSP